MSIESLTIALHHSRATGSAKLVLIGIANHDGDGGSWPAVATLAKYAGITPRNVQKAIDRLEQLGEVRRLISQGGDHSTADARRPNLYRFKLQCPHDCDRTSNHRTSKLASVMTELDELSTPLSLPTPLVLESTGRGVGSDTGRGVGSDTQTQRLNHLSLVNKTSPSTPAGEEKVGLPPADIHVASQQDWQTELRSQCPLRKGGGKHRFVADVCAYCGIRPDQYWRGKQVITDPEWRNS